MHKNVCKPKLLFYSLNKIQHLAALAFFTIISVFIQMKILLTSGIILQEDLWFSPLPEHIPRMFYIFPSTWAYAGSTFGASVMLGPDFPLLGFWYFLSLVGLSNELIIKALYLGAMILSGFSSYLFCKRHNINFGASLLGGTFYMLSPLIFNWAVRGLIYLMVGYALFPIVLILFKDALNKRGKVIAFSALLYSFAAVAIQNMIIVAYALSFYAFYDALVSDRKKQKLVSNLAVLAVFFSLAVLINLYWIIPTLLAPSTLFAYAGARAEDLVRQYIVLTRNLQLINSIRLWGFYDFIFEEKALGYGTITLFISFLPVILAYGALFLHKKGMEKDVVFFALLSFFSILVGSGMQSPIAPLNACMFKNNILFMSAFRDSYKFLLLAAFSYSFLISLCVDRIASTEKVLYSEGFVMRKYKKTTILSPRHLMRVFLVFMALSLIFLNALPYSQFYSHPDHYTFFDPDGVSVLLRSNLSDRAVEDWLSKQREEFRVAWLPTEFFVFYKGNPFKAIDYQAHLSSHPGGIKFDSNHENLLLLTMHQTRTERLGNLLGFQNFKYIVFRPDVISQYAHYVPSPPPRYPTDFSTEELQEFLKAQKDLTYLGETGNYTVYENQYYRPRIFSATSSSILAGDLRSLISLSYYFNLSESIIFFPQQVDLQTFQKTIPQESIKYVFIQDNLIYDLVSSFVSEEYKIAPSRWGGGYKLGPYPWYKWEYTTVIEDAAFMSDGTQITTPVKTSDGEHDLILKIFLGQDNGQLDVYLDGMSIKTINSFSDYERYSWVNVGRYLLKTGDHTLEFRSRGENVLASVIFGPTSKLMEAEKETLQFLEGKKIIYIFEGESFGYPIREYGSEIPSWGGASLLTDYSDNPSNKIDISLKNFVNGNYTFFVRAATTQPTRRSEITFMVDSTNTRIYLNSTVYNWYESEPIELTNGSHSVNVSSKGATKIDLIFISNFQFKTTENTAEEELYNYQKIDPTRHTIGLTSSKPTFLLFSDTFDTRWVADNHNSKLLHIPAYSFFNSYFINETGKMQIEIKFSDSLVGLQKIGNLISLTTIMLLVSWIIAPRRICTLLKSVQKKIRFHLETKISQKKNSESLDGESRLYKV